MDVFLERAAKEPTPIYDSVVRDLGDPFAGYTIVPLSPAKRRRANSKAVKAQKKVVADVGQE
jgi:hypothetical protein